VTFQETVAQVNAKRTRKAIAWMLQNFPDRAVAHVNAKLDEASRQEERRATFLSAVA